MNPYCPECGVELPPVTFGSPHHPMCSQRGGPGPSPVSIGNPEAMLADLDWEKRVLDIARERFHDIKQVEHADLRIKWMADPLGGVVPVLFCIFDPRDLEKPLPAHYADDKMPGVLHPCVTFRLTTISRSDPLSGKRLDGQRLADFLRRDLEHFLLRHGIVIQEPMPEGEIIKGTIFSR